MENTAPPQSALPLRAAVIGFLLSIFVALWGEYAANRLGYEPAATQLPAVVLLPFLLLVVIPNRMLLHFRPSLALLKSEIIIIFAMGLVASMAPDQAMTKYLLVVITAPHYFANPENRWTEQFFPYLPDWLVLSNSGDAARLFFEGLQSGQTIPWSVWVSPVFWWLSLIASLMFTGVCLVVILRKQWVEYERLRFPLGEVAMHLMGAKDNPDQPDGRGIFDTAAFRAGFLLMSGVMIWNILSFWGLWPHIPIMAADGTNLSIHPAYPPLAMRMNVFVFCLLLFVNVEILLSMWVFLVIYTFQEGFLNSVGISSTSGTIVAGGLVGIQSIGGLIAFVLWGLWMARRHIIEVVRKALGKSSVLRDEEELISYRWAVFGGLFGVLYLVCWLKAAGLSYPVMALFLFLLFTFYLALARVVAEAGLVSVDLPINSHQFSIAILGSANISHSDLTTLGMTNAFARNWRTFTMIGASHVAWFRDFVGTGRKHLFRLCVLAFSASTLTSISYVIYAGYTYGAQNLRTDIGGDRPLAFYGLITQWINNATRISEIEGLFLGSGLVIMGMITAARYLFYWWPLHPIGMVVVMSAPVRNAFLPIFLAWLIQAVLLRIGGGALYRKAEPLFIGVLMAYLLGQIVALGVDLVWFPDSTHRWEVY